MPPTSDVREDPTKAKLTWTPDGFTAEKGYTVSWPTNEEGVRQQMVGQGVYVNAEHPLNPVMLCEAVDVDMSKRNLAAVLARYKQTDSPFPDKSDPLSTKPRWRFRGGNDNRAVDRDYAGNALVNSAGQAFGNNYRNFRTRFISFIVIVPFFDISLDIRYANTVNSQPWNPLGIGSLARGQAMCLGIAPTGDITFGGKYVEVEYAFEIRAGFRALPLGGFQGVWDGFQRVILDQGDRCFYSATDTGTVVNGKNEPAGTVLLDGTGLPIVSAYKVSQNGAASVSAVAPPASAKTKGVDWLTLNPTTHSLTFQETGFQDFNDFGFSKT